MNPNDHHINFLIQFGKQIERVNKLYQSPIVDFAMQQQSLYERFDSIAQPHYFNHATNMLNNANRILSMCDQVTLATNFQSSNTALHTLINSYSKAYGIDFSKVLQSSAITATQNILSPLADSLTFQNAATFATQLSCGVESLVSALNAIQITPAYIEVPTELIPDNFEYGKKLNPQAQRKAIIKLSPEQTRFLIATFLAPLMFWIASYIASLSPTAWQEQYHQEEMENDAKLIQQNETIIEQNKTIIKQNDRTIQQNDEMIEIQQKQYEACLKGLETLETIYNQLDSDSENQSVSDHISPEVDSPLQQADSLPHYDESPDPDDRLDDLQVESHPHPVDSQPSTTQDSPAENTQSSQSD